MNQTPRKLLLNASCRCRPRMQESFLGSPLQQQVHLNRSLLAIMRSSSRQQIQTVTIDICSPFKHCPRMLTHLTIISSPIIPHVLQRCSRRLAAKAEQAGSSLVHSQIEARRVILR
jgi:hypothetical protein